MGGSYFGIALMFFKVISPPAKTNNELNKY